MALSLAEFQAITNDFMKMKDGGASDIYFYDSWLLNYLIKQQGGLWERPEGGDYIRVFLEYDGQEAQFYKKGDVLNSDDRESLNAARFEWKHCAGNATVYRIDSLKQGGDYGMIKLIKQRVSGAMKSLRKLLAGSIYDNGGNNDERLTGLLHCCSESSTVKYGDIAEDDLVAADGTKPWEGKTNTTSENIDLDVIRTQRSDAKISDGAAGKPDLYVTTETLFNSVNAILQVQQRFTQDTKAAKAGFQALYFEGCEIVADDYCPSGYGIAINTNHYGFAVHAEGYFVRTPWAIIEGSAQDKTMKILFDGNAICDNRKSLKAHSSLS